MCRKLLLMLMLAAMISGCKTVQTVSDGISKAVDMRSEYEKIEGQFIESERTQVSFEDLITAKNELEDASKNIIIQTATSDKKDTKQRAWNFAKDNMAKQAQQARLIEAPAFEKYMDDIVARLLEKWPHTKPDVSFKTRIAASPMYGAHTKGDGLIIINLGTVMSAESEDELAFMLAHELAHNLLYHSIRQEYLQTQSLWLEAGFNIASTVMVAKNLEMTKAGEKNVLSLANQELVSKSLVKNSANQLLIQNVTDKFLGASWSRTLEEEADLLGVDLIVRAGYSKNVARKAMQRIAASHEDTKSLLEKFAQAQKAALEQAFKEQGFDGVINQGTRIIADGAMQGGKFLVDKIGQQHASPEQREKYLQAYTNREYRKTKRVRINKSRFENARNQSKTQQILIAQQKITEALTALAEGKVDKAYQLTRYALKTPAKNSSRVRMVMYQVRKYQGKDDLALKNMELIANWDLAPLNAYDTIIHEYLRSGQKKKANAFLIRGQELYGKEPFYPLAVIIARNNNDDDHAMSAYDACQATNNATIKAACDQAIGELKPQKKRLFSSKSVLSTLGGIL